MPYLGNQPSSGGYHKLDNLTASATDTYALTLGGSAYYPATANQLLVSLNGVIQAAQDSFTISGSNIVFASALSASDSIDFIMSFGDVYGVGTPADGTITDAKIQSMAASKLTGALPAIDGSALTGVGGGAGTIAQIQYTQFDGTNTYTTTGTDPANPIILTDLTVNITPSATNSIIQLQAMVTGEFGDADDMWNHTFYFLRDTTKLAAPTAGSRPTGVSVATRTHSSDAASTPEAAFFQYFDSTHNTTSQITYKVGLHLQYALGAIDFALNRTISDTDSGINERLVSHISATEILQ